MLRALVPAERRRLVSALLDRSGPVQIEELSARLAADPDGETERLEASDTEKRSVAMRLRQVHLPALSSAGIVSWDEEDATVAATGRSTLQDPLVRRVLAEQTGAWDDAIDALADPRRRATVTILGGGFGPTSPSELARDLAVRVPEQPADSNEIEVSLRHCHLPKLDAAGLIEYDAEDDRVAFDGHPAVDGPWFERSRVDPGSGRLPPRPPEEFGDD